MKRRFSNQDISGSLIDRTPDEASRTAQRAAKAFGNELMGAVILSTVAGFVDTAGYMTLFGLFTAHVTGDLITAAAVMAEGPDLGAGVRLAMIPIFVITVAAVMLFARASRRRGAATLAPLLALMTAALALFCVTGVTLRPIANHPNSWAVALIGGTGVVAMGIQNALMRGALKNFSQTTIMTGNLTQFTIYLVELLFPTKRDDPQYRSRAKSDAVRHVKKSGFPLLGFMMGAALGALLTKRYGLLSIALPTVIVGLLSAFTWRRSRTK